MTKAPLILRSFIPKEVCEDAASMNDVLFYFGPVALKSAINSYWGVNLSYKGSDIKHIAYTASQSSFSPTKKSDFDLISIAYLNQWTYLDNVPEKHFTGGETIFSTIIDDYGNKFTIQPGFGDILIFPSSYQYSITRITSGTSNILYQELYSSSKFSKDKQI